MSNTGGIGNPNPPTPPSLPGLSASDTAGISASNVQAVLHTPVANLGQLKALLIANLGEQAGTKLYNSFMTSFAMIMMQQIQDSAQGAKQASQSMRTGTP